MARILVARKENEEIKVILDQERLTIGRDKKSDLFLNDSDVSRRHAVVINKHGAIYIENVSPTGQILKNKEPVEFCELGSGEEIRVGGFTLFWRDELQNTEKISSGDPANSPFGGSRNLSAQASDQVNAEAPPEYNFEAPVAAIDNVASPSNQENAEPVLDVAAQNPIEDFEKAPEEGADFLLGTSEDVGEQSPEQGLQEINLGASENPDNANAGFGMASGDNLPMDPANPYSSGAQNEDLNVVGTSDATRVSTEQLSGTLKIIKGENDGREILLGSDKNEWVVGRGSKSDIPIENAKISRSHFKIYRDGRAFKIADLGGSSGTRLNGVSIQDARLNSYDTIKAGPVEFQFIIGEKQLAVGGSSVRSILSNNSDLGIFGDLNGDIRLREDGIENPSPGTQEKTVFAAPIPYAPVGFEAPKPSDGGFAFSSSPNTSFRIPNTQFGASGSGTRAKVPGQLPQNGLDKFKTWYGNLNTTQKGIWGSLFVLLLLGLAMKINEESAPVVPPVAENNAISSSSTASAESPTGSGDRMPAAEENAAIKGDIDPAYYKLSKEKREQIDEAYAKAERAAQAKNWDEAYNRAKEVMDAVPVYKSAAQILYDAQNAKNNNLLGNISANLNNVADAAKENQEKIELLIDAGTKSLQAQEWQNAEENFLKAIALDPSNVQATEGYAKARARDMTAVANVPNAPVMVDPDAEYKKQIVGEIQTYTRTLNDAKELIRQGRFNQSLGTLRALDATVRDLNTEIKNDRTPASVRQLGAEKIDRLQLSIRESIDAAKLQLEAQYQTRLADAEAFISNKQYVQAKEIYHKILSAEPQFDRVVQERNKLYARLISEAREKYQEALIHENVGDIDQALEGFEQTKELLQDVDDSTASDYYRKSQIKIRRLKR